MEYLQDRNLLRHHVQPCITYSYLNHCYVLCMHDAGLGSTVHGASLPTW